MNAVTQYITDPKIAYKALNGICLLYKPTNIRFSKMKWTVLQALCDGLNNMVIRDPDKYVVIKGDTTSNMAIVVRDDYSKHPLVIGPTYQMEDFKVTNCNHIGDHICGLTVMGLNGGNSLVHRIQQSKPTTVYRVKGKFGIATDSSLVTGKVIEKHSYKHVRQGSIDGVCASIQSSHQRKMFEICGVDIQSQAAYELAVQGPIRPADPRIPMVYTIKCIDFSPPYFILEIVCINTGYDYLLDLVTTIATQLHTVAACVKVQCVRYGIFHMEHALLSKYWKLENIIANIQECETQISKNKFILNQESATLVEPSI